MGSPSTITDPLGILPPGKSILDPLGMLSAKSKVPSLPAPPKQPSRDDPSIEAARKAQRLADLRRKGRKSTIITGGAGLTSDAPLSQPQALGA